MALLTYGPGLTLSKAPQFEARFRPGQSAPVTGIYQCVGCGFEIVRVATRLLQSRGDPGLPRHPRECPQVSWRLLAQAEQKPELMTATAAQSPRLAADEPNASACCAGRS